MNIGPRSIFTFSQIEPSCKTFGDEKKFCQLPMWGFCTSLAAFPVSSVSRRRVQRPFYCCAKVNLAEAHREPQNHVTVTTIGNLCVDILLDVKRLPERSGDHVALRHGASVVCGGAFNCLISAARLGACAAPIGYVSGTISSGEVESDLNLWTTILIHAATRCNLVTSSLVPRESYEILRCAVLAEPNGERTFLSPAEELQLDESRDMRCNSPLPECVRGLLQKSRSVILDGYAFVADNDMIESFLSLFEMGTFHREMQVWIDPQAIGSSLVMSSPLFLRALQEAHGVCLTKSEALAILNLQDATPEELVLSMSSKLAKKAKVVVVKLGVFGCVLSQFDTLTADWTFQHVKGFEVDQIVDTTGCGDAFLGALLAGHIEHDMDLHEAAILANAVGAATAERRGAGEFGIALWDDTSRKLQQHERGRIVHALLSP